MKIEIKNRFTNEIILCGEYESVKDCLEKNKRANLSGLDLSRADLSGANLSGADLSRANLSGADLLGANLSGAYLSGLDLSRANLSGADLSGLDLSRADLSGADLSGLDLSRADLSGADLSRADLSGAYLLGANFNGEKLDKIPIQILGLRYSIFITKEQIKIGCELHKASKWKEFDDKSIIRICGKEALVWWRKNKELIFKAHENHCK